MQEGAEKLKPTFIKQGIEQVARRMLAAGADESLIAKATGLSATAIAALKY